MYLNRATMIQVCWFMFFPHERYGYDSHCKTNCYVYGWYSVQWRNLGMLFWHVYVIMIYYCRYVDIRDSFLLGQLSEQRWLWSTPSDGGYQLVKVNRWSVFLVVAYDMWRWYCFRTHGVIVTRSLYLCRCLRRVRVRMFSVPGVDVTRSQYFVVAYDMWEWECFVFLGLRSPGSSFELLSTCAHVLFSCGGFGS